jgi:hypothetical protein
LVQKPEDLTDKERLSERDDFEASFVPCALALDDSFLETARRVGAAPTAERESVARVEAKRYVSNSGEKQDLIVRFLLLAASEAWRERGIDPETYFANLSRRPIWGDEPADELDGRRDRVGREESSRRARLREGARRFVLSGAGKCVECGHDLGRYRLEARARELLCSPCANNYLSPPMRDRIVASYRNSIREALDAATRQHRKRRASRVK